MSEPYMTMAVVIIGLKVSAVAESEKSKNLLTRNNNGEANQLT